MTSKNISAVSTLLSFVSLMIFWLIMSGYYDLIHIGYGVVSVLSVMIINRSLTTYAFFEDDQNDNARLRPTQVFLYLFWILGQIVIAGWRVATLILRPSLPAKPALITFRVDLPSARARMILGNSITLTPGTLTLDIHGDLFTVHSIDKGSYEGIIDGSMPKQVLKLFSSEEREVIRDVRVQETSPPNVRSENPSNKNRNSEVR